MGLGGYPAVSLAAARDAAIVNLQPIKTGRDVIAENKQAQAAARLPTSAPLTFADVAATVIAMRRPTWSNPKHAAQWRATLETYAFPLIGKKPVDEITSSHAMAVLQTYLGGQVRNRQQSQATHGNRHGLVGDARLPA